MQEVVALTTSEPASADREVLLELSRNYVRSALLAEAQTKDLQAAARVLNLQVHVLNVSTDREFNVAFAKIAVCLVTRHGRLGWSLSEALGPGNADLDRKQLQEITNSFARAGVPHQSVITAIETILQANCTTKSRTRRQRQDLEQRL
jgi:hypothetical protein